MAYIYTITNLFNRKMYVGSTTQEVQLRWNSHISKLRRGVHDNQHLQNSWNNYGELNFKFEVLEECSTEYCLFQEQYWITMLDVCNRKYGYNKASRTQHFRLGMVNNPESIEKIKTARKFQKDCGQVKVKKFSIDGKFIKEYLSLKEAAIENNVATSNISKCCKGIYSHCGGFKWKYSNIDEIRKTKGNKLLIKQLK